MQTKLLQLIYLGETDNLSKKSSVLCRKKKKKVSIKHTFAFY